MCIRDRLRSDMQADPVSALREMGIEDGYSELATALYDEELGEDSPDEWKAQRETRELSARIRRLEQEQKEAEERIKSEKQQAEFNEFQRNYLRGMDSYMSEQLKSVKSEESGEMTIAQALYESNPTQAVEAMYGIALQVAHEDPNAPLPTPELLAEQLQVNLEESLGPIIEIMMKSRAKEKPQAAADRVRRSVDLQHPDLQHGGLPLRGPLHRAAVDLPPHGPGAQDMARLRQEKPLAGDPQACLLYTSDAADE